MALSASVARMDTEWYHGTALVERYFAAVPDAAQGGTTAHDTATASNSIYGAALLCIIIAP